MDGRHRKAVASSSRTVSRPLETTTYLRGIYMSLTKKVAIVTGGNSGIGKAIVLELAKQGACVVIDYVSHPEATDALEAQIAGLGECVIGLQADVGKLDDLQRLVSAAVEKFGHVDVMV